MRAVKTGITIKPNQEKVILKIFEPFDKTRIQKIIGRVVSLPDSKINEEYEKVKRLYSWRHRKTEELFLKRFEETKKYLTTDNEYSETMKLLIGSYFVNEYSLEHSALFNPSIVMHPDQSGLSDGRKRFIISLRATGEGHVSSIVFREGIVDENNNIELTAISRFAEMPEIILHSDELYEAHFDSANELSERVLFPQLLSESNGLEDARFTAFEDDNGEKKYYATYCAYDGHNISMRLLHTQNFLDFEISKLKGSEVMNKGMALFPRKVNGKYAMLSRQDNENNYIMFSDKIDEWNKKQLLLQPEYPWEFFQIGNCGSPIETEKGWLCLSHGVGPARSYSVGAFLLDLNDPSKVIGRSKEPLLEADEGEREGYVPNVVYTCGGMSNGSELIIPYAVSDYSSSFAHVNINDLLNELTA